METIKQHSHPSKSQNGIHQSNLSARPVLTQAENNTTLWIGHLQTDPTNHFAGQTFKCPGTGQLDNIQVFLSSVQKAGHVVLTVHEFDATTKTWGPAIGNTTVIIEKNDTSKWIRFDLQQVPFYKDATYGFRLQSDDALVGIGEAASGMKQPFTFGHEWKGDSKVEKGYFFTYFSLTFKVELRA